MKKPYPGKILAYIVSAFLLTNCGKKDADHAAESTAVSGSCQEQSRVQVSTDSWQVTYLCSQFRPSCFYVMLRGPVYSQVPIVISTTCPKTQVPPI